MVSGYSRRDALQFGGVALTLLAGCTTSSTPESQSTTSTTETKATAQTSTTSATTTDTASVTVDNVRATPTVVAPNSPDSIGTIGERDEQFVLATVASDGKPLPNQDEVTLETAADTYTPTEPSSMHAL
ncbi:hypothetical protein SAMN05421858_2429 [Haladaptatus litoreus]|uniref:Uncharacterized protein n=1 Tax=Haladaptatus litoreus TaxID=553468 RepID=A0A1N7B9Y6_9EURY|nr:hypothetical protein [Haladaptatus litoreus]SIR48104.1 hypothetical protein SAMN05421858_2429 [Haladaptatus litoreus]